MLRNCTELQRLDLSHFDGPDLDDGLHPGAVEIFDVQDDGSSLSAFQLRSCKRVTRLATNFWSKPLFDRKPGTLEDLLLEHLPLYAPSHDEVEALARACRYSLEANLGVRELTLGSLPSFPRSAPETLLSAAGHGLLKLSLCDIPLDEGAWAAILQLRGLRELTLRDVVSGFASALHAEMALEALPTSCPSLRRVDLYRVGRVITDRLCLSFMAANLNWRGGIGLRWLRLDFRFGAASAEASNLLATSSRCERMELRLLPADPLLATRSDPGLAALPRLQALVRAHCTRVMLRRWQDAAIRLQAVSRGQSVRRIVTLQQTLRLTDAAVRVQAWVRGHRARVLVREKRAAFIRLQEATVRVQAFVRGHRARVALREKRAACIRLQAVFRGFRARRSASEN